MQVNYVTDTVTGFDKFVKKILPLLLEMPPGRDEAPEGGYAFPREFLSACSIMYP
jgi:hypothetical protein